MAGGVIVREDISAHILKINGRNDALEIIGAKVNMDMGAINIRVYSCYLPPKKKFDKKEFEHFTHDDEPTIIGGDFNSKHPY